MKCLVLGRTGQVAFELMRAAWPAGLEAVAVGRPDFDMAQPDSLEPVLRAVAPDVVINATAYTAVDKAETEPALAFAINRDGPERLAILCRGQSVPLLHISTDYVFDGGKNTAYLETDPVFPLGIYGTSKEAGETAVRTAQPRHIILRTSWVYGVHGQNFLKTMLRLGAEREELGVVADQFGAPTAAADIAATLVRLAERLVKDPSAPCGTYHYTGGGSTSWHGFAERIFQAQERATGHRPRLKAITTADYPTPARRPANSRLDCTAINRAFGIVCPPWEQAVDRVLAALLATD